MFVFVHGLPPLQQHLSARLVLPNQILKLHKSGSGDSLYESRKIICPATYIQGSEEILSQSDGLREINELIIAFLNNIESMFGINPSMPERD